MQKYAGWLALSPLLVFLVIYLGGSLLCGDFYAVPVSAAFLLAVVYAFFIFRSKSLKAKIFVFERGVADKNILLMLLIFICSGVFSACAKAIGAIDATAGLMLHAIPAQFLYAGLFITTCFISFSMGTSVGTIVTLVPFTTSLAEQIGVPVAFMVAIVVGGAFFGDNLSFISDTTVAATSTQHVKMRDKFFANIRIVGPAAIIALVLYGVLGHDVSAIEAPAIRGAYRIAPYLIIILAMLLRLHIIVSLILGIGVAAIIGFVDGTLGFASFLTCIHQGIVDMGELIVVTVLAGGLLGLIRDYGGIHHLMELITQRANSQRGGKIAIAGITIIANLCTANNTIAILSVGELAREIAQKYNIPLTKSASIIDIFSCITQSFIPYGAQLLIAASLSAAEPLQLIPYLYYPMIMALFAIVALLRKS